MVTRNVCGAHVDWCDVSISDVSSGFNTSILEMLAVFQRSELTLHLRSQSSALMRGRVRLKQTLQHDANMLWTLPEEELQPWFIVFDTTELI